MTPPHSPPRPEPADAPSVRLDVRVGTGRATGYQMAGDEFWAVPFLNRFSVSGFTKSDHRACPAAKRDLARCLRSSRPSA